MHHAANARLPRRLCAALPHAALLLTSDELRRLHRLEGRLERQHLPQHHAQAPHVCCLGHVLVVEDHLRGHVWQRAPQVVHVGAEGAVAVLGEAEVGDLDGQRAGAVRGRVAVDQQVVGLHIKVDDLHVTEGGRETGVEGMAGAGRDRARKARRKGQRARELRGLQPRWPAAASRVPASCTPAAVPCHRTLRSWR
jgi:hypothetical protein